MVKGISRQVVVVRTPDTKLFEQAIFLVRDGALPRQGVTEEDILREAGRVAGACVPKPRLIPLWQRALCALGGAAITGTVWLLTVLL